MYTEGKIRVLGCSGAVIPAAVGILEDPCGKDPSASAPMGYLPRYPWGLFLMVSTPLARTILEWVSFEQASYK